MNAVEVRDLEKTYISGFIPKKVKALSSLSFCVKSGKIFSLLGPNGAGKTTTMKILVGLIKQDGGFAEIYSQKAGSIDAKRLIGYLPENPNFYDYLTGKEFLKFSADLFNISKKNKIVDKLIEKLGLENFCERRVSTYSKGMTQRLGIAQALIGNPKLLIFDEPLSGVDPIGRNHIKKIIRSLKEEGKTIILSSHILPDIEEITDIVGLIYEGKIIREESIINLISEYQKKYQIILQCKKSEKKAIKEKIENSLKIKNLIFDQPSTDSEKSDNISLKIIGEKKGIDKILSFCIEEKFIVMNFSPELSALEQIFVKTIGDLDETN